ncbi:hypothetical protein [Glutamicibacter arilaitensis]|uniref:hypothetical protein n=1 Tax=Glutamicibacter arilaitensis TaxID=256701 RepID=UPI0038515224
MRPKLIALLAASAIALVGCASAEPSVDPTATVAVDTAKEALEGAEPGTVYDPVTKQTMSMDEYAALPAQTPEVDEAGIVEERFADFAEDRADAHGVKKPDRKKAIDALHAFCDDGKPFKISTSKVLNDNLEIGADQSTCQAIG